MKHNRFPTIAAFLITLVIGIFMFLIVSECRAWTDHEFRATQYGSGDWKLTSLPAEIAESETYQMMSKLGYVPYVYMVHDSNGWDKEVMVLGAYPPRDALLQTKIRLVAARIAFDDTLPDEEVIVICAIVGYNAMEIYFGPERWQDKEFHEKVAKALNKERQKWTE